MSFVFHSPDVHWKWIVLSGPDTKDFLHRVTSANVKDLQLESGCLNSFLDPSGRIRAFFSLWNFAPHDYGFEFNAGLSEAWKDRLLAAIDQYTFAEKMTLTDATPSLHWIWIFPDAQELDALGQLQAGKTQVTLEGVRINHHGTTAFGRPWLSAWAQEPILSTWVQTHFPAAQKATPEQLEGWRISAVHPQVDAEITEQMNPLEIGLKSAISDQKGCYPGQEVIEKIIAIGAPSRRLVRIAGTGPAPQKNDSLYNLAEPPVAIGTVTSIHQEGSEFQILGILKKIHAKEGLEVQFLNPTGRGKITQVAAYT